MQSVHYLRSRYDFVNTVLYTLQSLRKAKGLTQYVHLKQGPKEILQTKDLLSENVHFVFYHPKARRALYIWKKNELVCGGDAWERSTNSSDLNTTHISDCYLR